MSSKPVFKLYRRKIFANFNCVRKLLFQILFILVLTCYLLLTEKISLPKWTKIRRKSAELGNQELKTLQSVHGTKFSQILNESPNENKNCSPFNHVGFLKIHKTGSSTVFNILARYALEHRVGVVTPPRDHLCYPHPFSRSPECMLNSHAPSPSNPSSASPSPHNATMLFNHVIFSPLVKNVIPQDSFWLATLRDPVSYYESVFYFLGLRDLLKVSFKRFVEHFDYFEPLLENLENGNYLKTSAFGLLEHVLGFEVPKGRGASGNGSSQEMVEFMEQNFDLVIIDKWFDEGLCILRKLLCWSLDDVTYLKQNQRSTKSRYTRRDRKNLHKALRAIIPNYVEVYEYFYAKFQTLLTKNLFDEAEKLQALNEKKQKECQIKGNVDKPQHAEMVPHHLPEGVKVKLFDTGSTEPSCLMMAYPESTMLKLLQLRVVV